MCLGVDGAIVHGCERLACRLGPLGRRRRHRGDEGHLLLRKLPTLLRQHYFANTTEPTLPSQHYFASSTQLSAFGPHYFVRRRLIDTTSSQPCLVPALRTCERWPCRHHWAAASDASPWPCRTPRFLWACAMAKCACTRPCVVTKTQMPFLSKNKTSNALPFGEG